MSAPEWWFFEPPADLPTVGTQVAFPWEIGAGPNINDFIMIMIPQEGQCAFRSQVGSHTHWIQMGPSLFGPQRTFDYLWPYPGPKDGDFLNIDKDMGKVCGEGLNAWALVHMWLGEQEERSG